MNGDLFDCTRVGAYYLWDHTGCESALDLWYCAEDLACYFERIGIFAAPQVDDIKGLGTRDPAYIEFVRHVAYRVYLYTRRPDAEANWFAAERLLGVPDWVDAIIRMAVLYRDRKASQHFIAGVRSENVRAYYTE